MKRILIPTDGSQASLHAVQALLQARRYDPVSQVDLLTVQPPLPVGLLDRPLAPEELDALCRETGEHAQREAARLLDDAGLPCNRRVELGPPAETIARVAAETGANEIYMGSRGLGSLSSVLLGSVAAKVLRLTELPVTLAK
ncbi:MULTISPECIES: universal stress protein [unclassified Achromobacter]|uniref:universal stress protein n=1 Tax=unclassified Achromobacter TaxID=2626865 RepID=UPI00069D0E5D|nr:MULTISPECIES: universal stress protein [unclassified Achromobacter]KOF52686.1 universal stress protein [Achromobacter sp. DMS1]